MAHNGRTDALVTRLLELHEEIDKIIRKHKLSYAETGIDDYVYTSKPASTAYIYFQLREAMTDYPAALAYLEQHAKKARALDVELMRQASRR